MLYKKANLSVNLFTLNTEFTIAIKAQIDALLMHVKKDYKNFKDIGFRFIQVNPKSHGSKK
jgi:hypothetical protein